MFNIGPEEILLILVIALVFLGPKRLPEVARQIGKGMREFRSLTSRAQEELKTNLALESAESREDLEPLEPLGSVPDGLDQPGPPVEFDPPSVNGAVKKPKAKKKKRAEPVRDTPGEVPTEAAAPDVAAPEGLEGAEELVAHSSVVGEATGAPVDPGPVGADTDPVERSG